MPPMQEAELHGPEKPRKDSSRAHGRPSGDTRARPVFELVLPAYNEVRSIETLIRRALASAAEAGFAPGEVAIIVVNNGSTDGTAEALTRLAAGGLHEQLRVVEVPHNQGYGHGLWQGLSQSQADYVGWTHADEQCDPADVFAALKRVRAAKGRVLAKGHRHGRSLPDRLFTHTFEACARLAVGLTLSEINAQPKVFARTLLARLEQPPKNFAFDLYVLYHAERAGLAIEALPVASAKRAHGSSKWATGIARRGRTILAMLGSMADIAWREGRL